MNEGIKELELELEGSDFTRHQELCIPAESVSSRNGQIFRPGETKIGEWIGDGVIMIPSALKI